MIRYPLVLAIVYLTGVLGSAIAYLVRDWGSEIAVFDVASGALEEGLRWPLRVLQLLGVL